MKSLHKKGKYAALKYDKIITCDFRLKLSKQVFMLSCVSFEK